MPLKEVTFQFLYVVGYPANNAVFRTGGFEVIVHSGETELWKKNIDYFITWNWGIFNFYRRSNGFCWNESVCNCAYRWCTIDEFTLFSFQSLASFKGELWSRNIFHRLERLGLKVGYFSVSFWSLVLECTAIHCRYLHFSPPFSTDQF